MRLCNDTITIYNSTVDPETGCKRYKGTVISGVSWYAEMLSSVINSGLKTAKQITIRVPVTADFGGKAYVGPLDYADADPDSCFTFRNGDIVLLGACDVDLPPLDLVSGNCYAIKDPMGDPILDADGSVIYAAEKGLPKESATVTGVVDNTRAPHGPHYKVVGS